MTLRDRLIDAICSAGINDNTTSGEMLDAVLSALPCTLSQLEMIEAGTAVVVSKDAVGMGRVGNEVW